MSMYTAKIPEMYFLKFGNQMRIPDAICNTPNRFHMIGGMLSSKEHGGSKKYKNLSAPIMKNNRLQMAVSTFDIFINENLNKLND